MKKGVLFTIHSYTGLLSGVFILLMSISGALLVFHEELDSLQYPELQKIEGKQILSIDSCFYFLQKEFPNAQISNVSLSENNNKPVIFSLYDSSYKKGTQSMQVLMHPTNGTVIQTRGGSKDIGGNFMSWLSAFHNSFHLEKKGEWMLGFFGCLFMISILSGLIIYRKKITDVLCFRKRAFQRNNVHQIIGVYALVFNLLIATTGVWMQRYVFKKEFYQTQQPYTPILKTTPPLFFSIDSAIGEAKKQYPDFTDHVIYFAQNKSRKTAVYGSRKSNSFIHSKKLADVIFLDSSGAIAKTAFVDDIDEDSRYDIINAQIHYGKFGGLPIKIVYFVLGLSGAILSITGFILWYTRKPTKSE